MLLFDRTASPCCGQWNDVVTADAAVGRWSALVRRAARRTFEKASHPDVLLSSARQALPDRTIEREHVDSYSGSDVFHRLSELVAAMRPHTDDVSDIRSAVGVEQCVVEAVVECGVGDEGPADR